MKHLEIIKTYLNKKKEENANYSNNAFARDLGVSGPFLSMILSGKKEIPSNLALDISKKLNLDEYTKYELLKNLLINKYQDSIFEKYLVNASTLAIETYLPLLDHDSGILKKWYYIAVLEFISCHGFTEDVNLIADKLNIKVENAQEAFFMLEQVNLLARNDQGELYKKERFLRIPTVKTHPAIREFHTQMIDKANIYLNEKTSDYDYKERLISGITLAVNPDNIEKSKELIEQALHKVSIELTKGSCSRVYQLNVQFFPLSN